MTLKKRRYLKCYFCRKIGCCTVTLLDESLLCSYGTGLSIWKWFIRLLVTSAFTVLPVSWIWATFHFHQLLRWQRILVVTIWGIIIIILVLTVCALLYELHDKFRHADGVYFWWNDKRKGK